MSTKRRRAGNRHRRAMRRVRAITTVTVLALALVGLLLWIVLQRAPEVTQRRFPVAYESLIRENASRNGLSPAYVAAVILAESNYNPEAVSSANAQGLMQLLPDTAEWIAGKFSETYTEGALFDPNINIRYGCWYLGFLMNRYHGDMCCSSAAYHAGQGNVDKWLKNPAYSPDGVTLATIPYDTTATYVRRVLEYYEKYETIYSETT